MGSPMAYGGSLGAVPIGFGVPLWVTESPMVYGGSLAGVPMECRESPMGCGHL